MDSARLIAYLNAIRIGDLEGIRAKLDTARRACIDLEHPRQIGPCGLVPPQFRVDIGARDIGFGQIGRQLDRLVEVPEGRVVLLALREDSPARQIE